MSISPFSRTSRLTLTLSVESGRNIYDVRRSCDRSKDGDLCYKELQWIETWMNLPATKRALGVNPDIDFQSCNMQVNQAFAMQGDGARNRAKLLPELVESGIRLLIYAGDADMACNYIVRVSFSRCVGKGVSDVVCCIAGQ